MRIEWIEEYLQRAEQLVYENKIGDALDLLYGLLYDEPGYANTHNVIGWAHLYYTGELPKAERHLKLAVLFNAEYAPPYLHLGALYMRQVRYGEALAVLFEGMVKPNAHRLTFLEQIAMVYEVRGDYREAIRFYKQALGGSLNHEAYRFTDSIKRCRKKRIIMMFTF